MEHHFNVEIAERYGINAAILLKNLVYWVCKNWSEKRHRHDGRTWTYASVSGMSSLFPYLSQKQITYALDKLVEEGIIITGNYNTNPFDKTKWYALTDKGLELVKNDFSISTKGSNQNTTKGSNREPQNGDILNIYNNIYNNTTNNKHSDNKKIYNITEILNKYDIDDDLKNALIEFAKMRKAIKKELTPHALELCIGKLLKMSDDAKERLRIVEQSVMNNWQGFYELKDKPVDAYENTAMSPTEGVDDIEAMFRRSYEK